MKKVDKVSISELKELSKKMMDDIVKADVDVEKEVVVIDAPLHVDLETYLLEEGSESKDIWGITGKPYPEKLDLNVITDVCENQEARKVFEKNYRKVNGFWAKVKRRLIFWHTDNAD